MKSYTKYITLLLLLLLSSTQDSAAKEGSLNNHVIIAFDDALPPQYIQLLRSGAQVQNAISHLSSSHKLLNNADDYYSYVNFALGRDIPMFKHFADPSISRQGKCIKWIPFDGYSKMYSAHGNWDDIAFFQGAKRAEQQGYGPFSLLTGAKQFSLFAARSSSSEEVASHTYLILVTDDYYAGMDDYRKEFDQVFAGRAPKIEQYFRYYYDEINSTYRFQEIDSRPISGNYKAILYEVIPNASFSLNSVLDYPATLGLKRVRGGYRIDLEPNVYDTLYCVSRIEVKVKGKKDTTFTFTSEDGLHIHSDVLRTRKLPSDSIEVTLSGWVQVKDKFYGGMEMSPYDPKYVRLQSTVKIPAQKQARVFGLPLLDCFWWWYPNNAELAALLWQFVIIFIVIIVVTLSIRKFLQKKTIYEPTDKELTIERID